MSSSQTTNPLKDLLRRRGHGAQTDLARELGIGEAQMSKYVNGVPPSYRVKKRIAKALRVEVDQLWPS